MLIIDQLLVGMIQVHLFGKGPIGVIQEMTTCDDEQMIVNQIIDDMMKRIM